MEIRRSPYEHDKHKFSWPGIFNAEVYRYESFLFRLPLDLSHISALSSMLIRPPDDGLKHLNQGDSFPKELFFSSS